MRISLTILSWLLFLVAEGNIIRYKRDACQTTMDNFNQCTDRAYQNYKEAFQGGDDGRPDWMARKSCNYLTEAVEDCSASLVGDCYDEDEVIVMKDKQLKNVMLVMEQSVEEWDTQKCPAIKAHIDRVRGIDNEETDEENKVDEAIKEQLDGGDDEENAVDSDNDLDNDGINNEEDNDDDNDGLSDDVDTDDDNDGIIDEEDNDDDNDGIVDEEDSDDDNDGIVDEEDSDNDNDGKVDEEDSDDDIVGEEDSDGTSNDEEKVDAEDSSKSLDEEVNEDNEGVVEITDEKSEEEDGSGIDDGNENEDDNGNEVENETDDDDNHSNSATISTVPFWVILILGYNILI